MFSYRAR